MLEFQKENIYIATELILLASPIFENNEREITDSEPCQISKIKCLTKKVTGFQTLTIFLTIHLRCMSRF